ncbi:MAG TPA: heme lyase CcmF/NrfE family subunit, partial [Gammaproteobacteria bacterium]|nr:heme lyase CcmF/NrfE family subunit [Gammaproteobacteria bacterium]
AQNSNTELPWIYKIAAAWGAHEGSLLLWATILSLWTLVVAVFSRKLPLQFVARVLGVMGIISIGFLLFMLTTSDPFTRLLPAAQQGADLNPILQDPAMAGHPPMLYMGYVGLSVAFAFAVAALIGGKMDSTWARWARPWTIVAWLFLTLGITLGSWWSYYELGWGGWWFWDPVENASFMPWLVATALIHSLVVTEKRGIFKSWTALLAISAFSLSLLGTFLVRSGVLISVHAFATDPRRGIFVLALIAVVVGSSLVLYAWRAPKLVSEDGFGALSRETFLLLNNLFLVVAAAAILLGTLYPLVLDALNLGKISVGPPYFNSIFMPLMLPLLILVGIGPYLYWKHDVLKRLLSQFKITVWIVAAVSIPIILVMLWGRAGIAAVLGVVIAGWLLISTTMGLVLRWRRRQKISRGTWGMTFAHLGVGVLALGIAVTSSFGIAEDVTLSPGQSTLVHGYRFAFDGTHNVKGPNYQAIEADIRITRNGEPVAMLHPQKRIYDGANSSATEADLDPGLFRDLYVAMGDPLGNGAWSMRFQYKPLIRFLWFGGLLMAFGGILAVSDRRRYATVKVNKFADARQVVAKE